jgi:hypothetical protein
MDLFIGIGLKEIVYLVWSIFLDAPEFFAHQIQDTDTLPESSLRYTMSFLGVGRIPTDLLGVPLSQFLVASQPPSSGGGGGSSSGEEISSGMPHTSLQQIATSRMRSALSPCRCLTSFQK